MTIKMVSITILVFVVMAGSSVAQAEVAELMMTMGGQEDQERFGVEVANVGDVNGDGAADLLVGASRQNLDGWGQGHLYFGGAEFDTIADVVFMGEEYDEGFAEELVGAGDLNGDGFDDIIIGADANDEGGPNFGKAYIYFGGSVVDSLPDVEIHGHHQNAGFAACLAGCGDVNVDGYDDIVISAFDAGGVGEAYVYFGGSPMDTLVDLYLDPGGSHEAFGLGVCGGEDVNGDGFADIVVGDAHYGYGRAYVYFGGPAVDPVADLALEGEDPNSAFGLSLAMCDLDVDGDAEIIVGSFMWSNSNGRVYVYRGGEALDEVPDLIITGQQSDQQLGKRLVAGADLDLDGYRDLCVWSHKPSDRYLIHFGDSHMDRVEEAAAVNPGGFSDVFGSGRAVFSASDSLTGDGVPDLVVGACKAFSGPWRCGRVYFFSFFDGPVEIETTPHGRRVPAGGELRYDIEGINTTVEPQTFQVWSEALLPDGFLYEGNPLWGPLERTIVAGDTVTVELTQRIPYAAPPGQYSWTVRVGPVYLDSLWDSSSFEFKVVEP